MGGVFGEHGVKERVAQGLPALLRVEKVQPGALGGCGKGCKAMEKLRPGRGEVVFRQAQFGKRARVAGERGVEADLHGQGDHRAVHRADIPRKGITAFDKRTHVCKAVQRRQEAARAEGLILGKRGGEAIDVDLRGAAEHGFQHIAGLLDEGHFHIAALRAKGVGGVFHVFRMAGQHGKAHGGALRGVGIAAHEGEKVGGGVEAAGGEDGLSARLIEREAGHGLRMGGIQARQHPELAVQQVVERVVFRPVGGRFEVIFASGEGAKFVHCAAGGVEAVDMGEVALAPPFAGDAEQFPIAVGREQGVLAGQPRPRSRG